MAYRNGTYVAFHADGTSNPTESDMKYYGMFRAWTAKKDDEFSMVNSHEKTSAVRDSSKRDTLMARLKTRLLNSKHLLLIIGSTTKNDKDWVPFEISYAIDECGLPVIAAYTNYEWILAPAQLSHLWPPALKARITDNTARVIHIPFKKEPIKAAIQQFGCNNLPTTPLSYYIKEEYIKWGIMNEALPGLPWWERSPSSWP